MPVLVTHIAACAINNASLAINNDPENRRNLWDILWSCAVTVFACTWIAVHPNIPAADDTPLVIAFRRAALMVCGILAPEIIILWAMRQWYSARKIGQVHGEKGWTTTHGFFLQMGGFIMYDGSNPPYPLQLDDLVARYTKGEIDWPDITEREIQDRSKGDAFSKGVVVFQTSWFLVQCIGRGAVGLAITELELVTLAFAALNAVTYFFWWNKPTDVQCAHPVYPKGAQNQISRHILMPRPGPAPHRLRLSIIQRFRWWIQLIWMGLKLVLPPIYEIYQRGSPFAQLFNYFRRPVMLVMTFFVGIVLPITGGVDDFHSMKRVPTLHAARFESNAALSLIMTLACALLGSVFGGIHCIAWSFEFSSHMHRLLWRTSSLVITCAPLVIALASTHMSNQDHFYTHYITPTRYRNPRSPPASVRYFDSAFAIRFKINTTVFDDGRTSFEFRATDSQPNESPPPVGAETRPQLEQVTSDANSGCDTDSIPPASTKNTLSSILPSIKLDFHSALFLRTVVWSIKCIFLAGTTVAYIAARVILIIQALMELKSLSPTELQAIEWTNYIPHI